MESEFFEAPLHEIKSKIEQVTSKLETLKDPEAQHQHTSKSVKNFVRQVLGYVNGNPDIPEVNKVLVDSLLEIERYIVERPNEINAATVGLNAQKDAYVDCVNILVNAANQATNRRSAVDRVVEKLDESGEMPRRSIGDRPEKMRDIRQAQERLKAGDIPESDI